MEKQFQVSFPNGVANQKFDLYFTVPSGGQFNGVIEVYLECGYGYSNGMGEIIQRFTLGCNDTGTIYLNTSRCVESMGNTANELAVSALTWDATNSRYRIQVVHRTSNGNPSYLVVRCYATATATQAAFATLAVTAVYTTDSTVFGPPTLMPGGVLSSHVTAQFNKTSDTTLANVPGLSVTLLPGVTYAIKAYVAGLLTSNPGGMQLALSGTVTASVLQYNLFLGSYAQGNFIEIDQHTALNIAIQNTSNDPTFLLIEGSITVSAGGTLTVQFAQFSSSATASSVLVGSYLMATPIN
jgi:hypothetical protein